MKNKKGIALSQAFGAVLTLVLVAVLVIVAILIFANLNTAFAGTESVSIINETVAGVSEVPVFVANASDCSFGSFGVIAALNATSDTVIPASNYTVGSTGSIAFTTGNTLGVNGSNWEVTYDYKWGGEACNAGDAMITQFGTYPVLIGLVGTVIFLGLVIGVLVASFVFGRRDGV